MGIERERGISVVDLGDDVRVRRVRLQPARHPGHEDFSEDTYRTLTAVDSAVMVLDAAKGIEAQTRKLFEVCRLRDIPIVTFINKMDREGRDPFELLDEIERILALDTAPMTWPIGRAGAFAGTYDLRRDVRSAGSMPTSERRRRSAVPMIRASLPSFPSPRWQPGATRSRWRGRPASRSMPTPSAKGI